MRLIWRSGLRLKGGAALLALLWCLNASSQTPVSLQPPSGEFLDAFGYDVDLDGNLAVISDILDNNVGGTDAGSAHVFRRVSGAWQHEQMLLPTSGFDGQRFGEAVATSSGWIAVSRVYASFGVVHLFQPSGSSWTEAQVLVESQSGAPFTQAPPFGGRLAMSGDTLAVGGEGDRDLGNDAGAVFFYRRVGSTWTLEQKVFGSDTAVLDHLGVDVALSASGSLAVAGAWGEDDTANASGAAYIFERVGGTWLQQEKLLASDGGFDDRFGERVAIAPSGNLIAVAAVHSDEATTEGGAVYVFRNQGGTWVEEAKLTPASPVDEEHFGIAVAVTENTILVGSERDHHGSVGAAFLFRYDGVSWSEAPPLTFSGSALFDAYSFGVDLSDDESIALVGAPKSSPHAAHVFTLGTPPPSLDSFIRGDCNDTAFIDISDAIYLIGVIFPPAGLPPQPVVCEDACDANDDGSLDIADTVAVLGSLFGNPVTVLPFPNVADGCGEDLMTPLDLLNCVNTLACP